MNCYPSTEEAAMEAFARELFRKFAEVQREGYGTAPLWDDTDPLTRQGWLAVADLVDSLAQWKMKLRKYGRHLPSCPTGAPCQCGFEEVERQVA
jgi:hypothetical protein